MAFQAVNADVFVDYDNKFKKNLLSDTELDDESRAELLTQFADKSRTQQGTGFSVVGGADYRALNAQLTKAREGIDPLYVTRRNAQNTRKSILAQPGRGQTILTR